MSFGWGTLAKPKLAGALAALGLLFLAGALPMASAPAPAPADPALKLEQALRSVKALEADFDQFYYSSSVAKPLHEKGRLFFERPNLMRWEYFDPEPKVFLYKDEVFSQYYPEDQQLIRSRLAKEQYESEVLTLLGGQKDLGTDYVVERDLSSAEARSVGRLKLTPRVEGEYAWISLDPDPRTGLILRAVFQDWAENRTEFRFSKIRANPPLQASVFTLTVPPGTEIIEEGDQAAPPLKRKVPGGGPELPARPLSEARS